jgi:hypothetical protein
MVNRNSPPPLAPFVSAHEIRDVQFTVYAGISL